ncbi:MAG: SLC13 family permease, partial [Bacteroidia bacterium]|nr:SLC13 family permease [Bacteroidia bacterium]
DGKQAFAGFSSSSVVVVAVLFVVIAGLTNTGVLNWIVKHMMGQPRTLTGAIARLMFPVALLSSMLSNTTVVALFINVVRMWSKKLGLSPSKLLIPLSYASGMGGICTLIGTPPNLIISGMYAEQSGVQLGIMAPALTGLFCLAVGVLSMIAMQKLLPDRKPAFEGSDDGDFTTELLVASDNPYIGMTIAEARESQPSDRHFRNGHNLVLGVRRADGMLMPCTDDLRIEEGDRVFVSGRMQDILWFSKHYAFRSEHLAGVMESEGNEDAIGRKTIVSSLIMVAMVLLSAFNVLPLLTCCLLAAFAMVICRCCTSGQAMNSINWNIIIVFAGSVAIGNAIENTGIASLIANGLLGVCGTNPYVVLFTLCLVATFITEFISNTAAGAMFCPIALSTAATLGVNPMTFCIALMVAVSSSFATPIGSPTHMLVYTPGGYRFTDFMKVGLPMNIIILIANILITTIVYPF